MANTDPSQTSDLLVRIAAGRWIRLALAGMAFGGIVGTAAFLLDGEGRVTQWARAHLPAAITGAGPEISGLAPVSAGAAARDSGHIGKTYALEAFVVNILDRDRDRFLKVKTELELETEKLEEEIISRLPQIRDLIIGLLGSKTFEDVRTIEGKNFLREEMLLRINALLVTGEVRRIFFTEFVVQ
jgi:flagellar basal body-associated protein FliL